MRNRGPHHAVQALPQEVALGPAAAPQRADDAAQVLERDVADAPVPDDRKDMSREAVAPRPLGVRRAPGRPTVLDDGFNEVPYERDARSAGISSGITTSADHFQELRGKRASLSERNLRVPSHAEVVALPIELSAHHPAAGAGVLDEEVETLAIGMTPGRSVADEQVGETGARGLEGQCHDDHLGPAERTARREQGRLAADENECRVGGSADCKAGDETGIGHSPLAFTDDETGRAPSMTTTAVAVWHAGRRLGLREISPVGSRGSGGRSRTAGSHYVPSRYCHRHLRIRETRASARAGAPPRS